MQAKLTQNNIPKGWQIKQIKDLLDYERPDKYIVESDRYLKSGTPVLTANKSFILGYTDEKSGIYNNLPAIIFDDFTTDSKLVDFPFKVKSSAIKILREKNKEIDLRFVYEKMKSINFPTGNHKRYYISQYQNMEILIPSFNEQTIISEILNAVNDQIQKTDEIIFLTEKLKRNLMQKLFTKGIGHIKFKKTKIGEIPETWPVLRLGDNVEFKNGFAFNSRSYSETGKILIRMSNISTTGELNINDSNIKFIPESKYNELSEFQLRKGDLIMSMTDVTKELAIIGRTAIIDKNDSYILNQRVGRLRTSKNLNSIFLHYLTNSDFYLSKIHEKVTGSAQFNLSTHDIKESLIPLPTINEQEKISEILLSLDMKISINKNLKEKLFVLKKGLAQDLLTGKKRTV